MNTIVNVDVNELLADIRKQSKAIRNLKNICYILAAYIGYKYAESKDLKNKIKTLTNELEGLKATKGE